MRGASDAIPSWARLRCFGLNASPSDVRESRIRTAVEVSGKLIGVATPRSLPVSRANRAGNWYRCCSKESLCNQARRNLFPSLPN